MLLLVSESPHASRPGPGLPLLPLSGRSAALDGRLGGVVEWHRGLLAGGVVRAARKQGLLLGVQLLVEADLADCCDGWIGLLGPLVQGLVVDFYVSSLEVDDGSA